MPGSTQLDTASAEKQQVQTNTSFWARSGLVAQYASAELRPAERVLLEKYRDELAGRVLELGCGAGRITGHLVEIATHVHAIDLSPSMVEHCRRTYPQASFEVGDLRDLTKFEAEPLDAVVAPFNVIDVLDHAERRRALDGIRRVLEPNGLLIVSSHNKAHAPLVRGPAGEVVAGIRSGNARAVAASVAKLPRRMRNRRRLGRYQYVAPGYAVLNDRGHDYSMLHYYISRDGMARQFAEHGFTFLECVDLDGNAVGEGEQARDCAELHYVARRRDE